MLASLCLVDLEFDTPHFSRASKQQSGFRPRGRFRVVRRGPGRQPYRQRVSDHRDILKGCFGEVQPTRPHPRKRAAAGEAEAGGTKHRSHEHLDFRSSKATSPLTAPEGPRHLEHSNLSNSCPSSEDSLRTSQPPDWCASIAPISAAAASANWIVEGKGQKRGYRAEPQLALQTKGP